MATPFRRWTMSAGIGRKAVTAQTPIVQSVAATEHAPCAKATIKSPPDYREHPHARISFQQFIAYCCHPKTNPGFPTETRGWDGGDGGNRTPVQWPAPNSSPSAVYGFISRPPALRRLTAGWAQLIECRSRPTNMGGTQWLPRRRQTPGRKQLPG